MKQTSFLLVVSFSLSFSVFPSLLLVCQRSQFCCEDLLFNGCSGTQPQQSLQNQFCSVYFFFQLPQFDFLALHRFHMTVVLSQNGVDLFVLNAAVLLYPTHSALQKLAERRVGRRLQAAAAVHGAHKGLETVLGKVSIGQKAVTMPEAFVQIVHDSDETLRIECGDKVEQIGLAGDILVARSARRYAIPRLVVVATARSRHHVRHIEADIFPADLVELTDKALGDARIAVRVEPCRLACVH